MIVSSNSSIQSGKPAYFVALTTGLLPVDSRKTMTFSEPNVVRQNDSIAFLSVNGGSSPVSVTMAAKSRQLPDKENPPVSCIDQLRKKLLDEQQRQQERRLHIHAHGLQVKLTDLKTEVAEMQQEGGARKNHHDSNGNANLVDGLLKRIADLESKLSVSNQVANFLQAEYRSNNSDCVGQGDSAELKNRVRDLQAELGAKDEVIRKQEKKCLEYVATIRELEMGLTARIHKSQEMAVDGNTQLIADLQTRLRSEKTYAQVLQEKGARTEEERQKQQDRANSLEAQLKALREQLKEKSDWSEQISDLQTRLSSATAYVEVLQEMGARAEEERQKQEDRASSLEAQLEDLRESDWCQQIAELQTRLNSATTDAQVLREKGARADEERQRQEDRANRLEAQVRALCEELEKNLAELELAKQRFSEEQGKTQELGQQISGLEERLKQLTMDNEHLTSSVSLKFTQSLLAKTKS